MNSDAAPAVLTGYVGTYIAQTGVTVCKEFIYECDEPEKKC